jgi:hypothetical protein
MVWVRCPAQHKPAEASRKETEAAEVKCNDGYSEGMERVNARRREIGGQEEEMICLGICGADGRVGSGDDVALGEIGRCGERQRRRSRSVRTMSCAQIRRNVELTRHGMTQTK